MLSSWGSGWSLSWGYSWGGGQEPERINYGGFVTVKKKRKKIKVKQLDYKDLLEKELKKQNKIKEAEKALLQIQKNKELNAKLNDIVVKFVEQEIELVNLIKKEKLKLLELQKKRAAYQRKMAILLLQVASPFAKIRLK